MKLISGQKLQTLMDERGLKQNKLAIKSHVQDETIRTIRVSGTRGCSVHNKTVVKLCAALGVNEDRVLVGTHDGPIVTSALSSVLRDDRSSRLKSSRDSRSRISRGPLTGTWFGEIFDKNGKIAKYDRYKVSHKGERVYFVKGRRLFPKDQRNRRFYADAWFRQGILAGRYKPMNPLAQHRMGSFLLMLDHDTNSFSGFYLRVHERSEGSGKVYRSIQTVEYRWSQNANPEYVKNLNRIRSGTTIEAH
jgi:DNA-binding Xre family transcriptional regulator